jgi:hypothetical protein
MATAFLPLANLFSSLQALIAWFAPQPAPAPAPRVPRVPARVAAPRAVVRQPIRPLRVLRVVEPCASRAVAGRMVISGRLADVCAELERLAAQEARSQ